MTVARCGCSNTSCSCLIIGAGAITVTGSGIVTNPYVINGGLSLQVVNTSTVTMSQGGSGTISDPYTITAYASMNLADLEDVVATNMTTGHVLARQADGTWAPAPPATVATGAINTGNGIIGDGSSGSPLNVRLAASSGLEIVSTGLRIQSSGGWSTWTPQMKTTRGQTVTIPNGSQLRGRWKRDGNTVHLALNLTVGNNFPKLEGTYMFTLPVPDRGILTQLLTLHAVLPEMSTSTNHHYSERQGTAVLEGDGMMTRVRIDNGTYSARAISQGFPQWVPGTRISISGSYEAL